jgi:pimeloyl-ACP methyl ester carboxylesterase
LVTLADGVAGLGVPTAIIYGAADPLCARHMEQLAERLPNAFVVRLQDCGHYLQEDCPEKLQDALVEFLKTLPP